MIVRKADTAGQLTDEVAAHINLLAEAPEDMVWFYEVGDRVYKVVVEQYHPNPLLAYLNFEPTDSDTP